MNDDFADLLRSFDRFGKEDLIRNKVASARPEDLVAGNGATR